jgi:hypothetical protein
MTDYLLATQGVDLCVGVGLGSGSCTFLFQFFVCGFHEHNPGVLHRIGSDNTFSSDLFSLPQYSTIASYKIVYFVAGPNLHIRPSQAYNQTASPPLGSLIPRSPLITWLYIPKSRHFIMQLDVQISVDGAWFYPRGATASWRPQRRRQCRTPSCFHPAVQRQVIWW